MRFWKNRRVGQKIVSFLQYIPHAFRRYTLTSFLMLIAIAMTVYTVLPRSSQVMKIGKSDPVEYYITLSPPKADHNQESAWIDGVESLLRQNNFESYPWIYKDKKVIDVIGLFNRKVDVRKIKSLLQKNGFMDGTAKIEANKTASRFDIYDIEFETNEKDPSKKTAWGTKVQALLLENGYFASADYGWHNPAARGVNYPPFREAEHIIALIREKGLQSPSAFAVYDNMPVNEVVISAEGEPASITLSGHVPLQKYNPRVHPDGSVFLITVFDPAGNAHKAQVTAHPFAGFRLEYPKDFIPHMNGVSKGKYQVVCFLNNKKAFENTFERDDSHAVVLHDAAASKRVFYKPL